MKKIICILSIITCIITSCSTVDTDIKIYGGIKECVVLDHNGVLKYRTPIGLGKDTLFTLSVTDGESVYTFELKEDLKLKKGDKIKCLIDNSIGSKEIYSNSSFDSILVGKKMNYSEGLNQVHLFINNTNVIFCNNDISKFKEMSKVKLLHKTY